MRLFRSVFALLVALILGLASEKSYACPFCSAPGRTLSEQLQQADAALLVRVVSREQPNLAEKTTGRTVYEVIRDLRDADATNKPGDRITLSRFDETPAGTDRILLLGSKTIPGDWAPPVPITEAGIEYLSKMPAPEAEVTERLRYFVRFLESPDELIAQDAFGEFANADYKHIAAIAESFDAATVRGWIASPKTNTSRLALYGLLLGLSGDADDAEFLKGRIVQRSEQVQLGTEGLISGYLLLARDEGLAVVERTKLQNKACDRVEAYAAMQAVEFMWTYGAGAIGKDRLRAAMRTLLDRPALAELVIVDLGRWSDWSVSDRLMQLYSDAAYEDSRIKRAIVRYYLTAEISAKDSKANPPDHVLKARSHLAMLRQRDPETVTSAEESYYFNF